MRRLFLGSLVGVGLLLLSAAAPARAEWDFGARAVRPYLQGKVILADATEAALAFGVRF